MFEEHATEWLQTMTESDPPTVIRPLRQAAHQLGWMDHLGLQWQLDAALCTESEANGAHHVRPALLVRPMLRAPLDGNRVRRSYLDWLSAVGSAPKPLDAMWKVPVPSALSLLRPTSDEFHSREPDPLDSSSAYWDNHLHILDQARRLLVGATGAAPNHQQLDALLVDYPFVVAAIDHPKVRWDRHQPLRKPVGIDALTRVGPRPTGPGRPPSYHPPHLAAEVLLHLPDGRSSEVRRHRLPRGLPSAAPYWALRVVTAGRAGEADHPLIQEAREWIGVGATTPESMDAAASRLATYQRNRLHQSKRGRPAGSGGKLPRFIAPYLCPDLSVYRRRMSEAAVNDNQELATLLADWTRSKHCARMLEICTGGQLERLSLREEPTTSHASDTAL